MIHVLCFFLKVVQETEDPDLKNGDPVGLKKNMTAPISEHVSAMSHFLVCCALLL